MRPLQNARTAPDPFAAANEARQRRWTELFGPPPKPPTIPSKRRRGRNEPCACGSGRKFKNCCRKRAKARRRRRPPFQPPPEYHPPHPIDPFNGAQVPGSFHPTF